MTKPDWMKRREGPMAGVLRFRRCVNCRVGGDVCGQTNYISGEGRLNMYRCRKHPTVRFYRHTYACEDFEPRR